MTSPNWKWRYPATLIRVIDGDTVVLSLDLGLNISRSGSYRLEGINAIERDKPSTDYLAGLLNDAQFIEVETCKADKYGRYLATLFVKKIGETEWMNVNKNMIDNKFAVEYSGGKR